MFMNARLHTCSREPLAPSLRFFLHQLRLEQVPRPIFTPQGCKDFDCGWIEVVETLNFLIQLKRVTGIGKDIRICKTIELSLKTKTIFLRHSLNQLREKLLVQLRDLALKLRFLCE